MGIFTGQIAIVTGASSGVGKAIARHLATHGAILYLVGRNRENLEKLATEIRSLSTQAFTYEVDLARTERIGTFVSRLRQDVCSVDLLIHSAGVISPGRMETTSVENL